jgi:hypothetical protein
MTGHPRLLQQNRHETVVPTAQSKAEIWSHGHPAARTLVLGAKGTVFMGTRQIGRVYAITDKDGKREVKTLLQGLTQPNRLAVKASRNPRR